MNERDNLKQRLIQIYQEYLKYPSPRQFKNECSPEISDIILANVGITLDIQNKGILLGNNIKTAVLVGTKMATIPEKLTSNEIIAYCRAMENIIAGKEEPETGPAQPYEAPKEKYTIPIPPEKPKKRTAHIKKGTRELQTEETLNTRILRTIRAKPQKNHYKQQHSEYFKARIEEQTAIMQTPNPNPRRTQEQKDAYYAFQTEILASSASSPTKWSGLEQECMRIGAELSKEQNYDTRKILEFYGIEMACLKIIKKEKLPDELARIMCELL